MDHVNNTFSCVEDKLLVRWGRYFYIPSHFLRYSEDMRRGIYSRIIGQWYVAHELRMSELDRRRRGLPREMYREGGNIFQDDRFVLTFHWIFGLRDANLLELLFDVFVLPMISGIGGEKTSIDTTDLIFREWSFIPQVAIRFEECEYSIMILPSLMATIGFLPNTNLSRSCLLVRSGANGNTLSF